jgi:hypothetical protein
MKSHGKVRTDGAEVDSGWITQTTEVKLAPVTGDPWERITAQAKADMLHKGRLFWAVESMIREQTWQRPAEGRAAEAGEQTCDCCANVAPFTWERSDAYRKKHAGRKVKGNATPMLPVSWRCSTHVPVAFPELAENYRDARVVRVSAQAVA